MECLYVFLAGSIILLYSWPLGGHALVGLNYLLTNFK